MTTAAMVLAVGAGPVQARTPETRSAPVVGAHVAVVAKAKPKPKVKKVKPASGPLAGGTTVKVKGKNFVKVKKVLFGTKKSKNVRVKNKKKLIVVVPPGRAAGVVPVVVVTRTGRSKATRKARFTYVAGPVVKAPTLTSISPDAGPTTGGTTVDLVGTGLTGTTSVTFGGTPAASFTVQSPTLVRAVTPAHAAGVLPVVVRNAKGASGPVSFNFQSPPVTPPVVVLVSPVIGSVDGGTAVTITGAAFTGATSVTFGGAAATSFSVDTDTSITAVTPAHAAGPVTVAVTTPAGTSAVPGLFTYSPLPTPPPVVVLVSPLTGPATGGTAVTITGTGFSGATAVTFDGVAATSFSVESDLSISAVTPAHAVGPVAVAVTTPLGTSTVPGLFTYNPLPTPPPVVALVAPLSGPVVGGTQATITGTGFSGATAVSFGGTPAASFTVESDTSISAVTPAHVAGLATVSVTTPAGTSTVPGLFTYNSLPPPPPVVVLVAPLTGPVTGGTAVTITGTGFLGATAVTIGGTAATSYTVSSDTSITATTPAHDAGPVTVSVTTAQGTSTVPGLFTYSPLPVLPLVILVTPPIGSPGGGTAVTITGTGLTGATAVSFGGTAATSFTVDSDTSISATAPAHAIGPVTVSVTTPGGMSTVPGLFLYAL